MNKQQWPDSHFSAREFDELSENELVQLGGQLTSADMGQQMTG
jgi:hypothetical protein